MYLQYKECSQYFAVTVNGKELLNTVKLFFLKKEFGYGCDMSKPVVL